MHQEIRTHVLASERVRSAQAIIEAGQADGTPPALIDSDLTLRYLPTIDEIDLLVATHSFSWSQLHRRRMKLLAALQR